MKPPFTANRIRLAFDVARPFGEIVDQITGASPEIAFGTDFYFEQAVFNNGVLVDVTQLDYIEIIVKPLTAGGVIDPFAVAILNANSGIFNPALTIEEWENDDAGNGQPWHARIGFSAAQTSNIDMTGHVNNVRRFGIVAQAKFLTGEEVLCGSGLFSVRYSGAFCAPGTPTPASYTFSDAQLEAMMASKLNAGENGNRVSLVLRGANGTGLLLSVDDSTGPPVLTRTVLPERAALPRNS